MVTNPVLATTLGIGPEWGDQQSVAMTGNLQAIGFIASWVLGWGIGGSLIDAGLINAGVYEIGANQLGTLTTFSVLEPALGLARLLALSAHHRLKGQAPVGNAGNGLRRDSSPGPRRPATEHERGSQPPGLPGCQPGKSSKAQQSMGLWPRRRAANWKASGAGLPLPRSGSSP